MANPDGEFLVPKVPLYIEAKTGLLVMGLLDTGATHSYINLSMAEIIGIDLKNKETMPTTVVGGTVDGIETDMGITVIDNHTGKRYKAKIPVIVLQDSDLDEIIIGRTGFFNLFKVTFKENEKLVVLRPYPENRPVGFVRRKKK